MSLQGSLQGSPRRWHAHAPTDAPMELAAVGEALVPANCLRTSTASAATADVSQTARQPSLLSHSSIVVWQYCAAHRVMTAWVHAVTHCWPTSAVVRRNMLPRPSSRLHPAKVALVVLRLNWSLNSEADSTDCLLLCAACRRKDPQGLQQVQPPVRATTAAYAKPHGGRLSGRQAVFQPSASPARSRRPMPRIRRFGAVDHGQFLDDGEG